MLSVNPRLKRAMEQAVTPISMTGYPGAGMDDEEDGPPVLRRPDVPPNQAANQYAVEAAPELPDLPPPNPAAPTLAPPAPVAPNIPPLDPRVQKRYGDIMSRLEGMDQPESTSSRLVRALATVVPLMLAPKLGGIHVAGGMAQGTAQGLQLAHERQMGERQQLVGEEENLGGTLERAREANTRNLQAQAQLEATRAWHNATVGVQAQRVQGQQRNFELQHEDRNRKLGLDADGNPIPEEQLSAAERTNIAKNRAAEGVAQARKVLAEAQATAIPQRIKLANQQLQVALSRLNMAQQGLQLRQRTFEANYYGTDQGTPIPGAPTIDGTPVGFKGASYINPTSQSRGAAEQGNAIIAQGENVKRLIDQHRDKLGNVSSILNSVFLNTPLSDPVSANIAAEIKSYVALQPRLHGFRGQSALQEFSKIVGGLPKDPDSLKAAIDGIASTAGAVRDVGTPKVVKPGATRPKPAAPGGGTTTDEQPDFIVGPDGKVKKVMKLQKK